MSWIYHLTFVYYSTMVCLRASACLRNDLLRLCCINSSQLHQTPGEMERHSTAPAEGQANIQDNKQQISATSRLFSSPFSPLLRTLSVFIDIVVIYINIGTEYGQLC